VDLTLFGQGLSFANPLGVWALVGIPAVLLVHFFQRRSKVVRTSTLFLLERMAVESLKGRRLDRLRSSASLWLQLLSVLLLVWLLIQPRWLVMDSVQRAVFLLDSSASMTAYRNSARRALEKKMEDIGQAAGYTEWILIETNSTGRTLYSGDEPESVLAAFDRWEPRLGHHDFSPSFEIARSLGGEGGVALFLSDHATPVPAWLDLVSVGKPKENIGFTGVSLEERDGELVWRALVRNYSGRAAEASWWVEVSGKRTQSKPISLTAAGSRQISGPFPPEAEAFEVVLTNDEFPLDDRLPIVRPRPKTLSIFASNQEDRESGFGTLLDTLESIEIAEDATSADLILSFHQVQNIAEAGCIALSPP